MTEEDPKMLWRRQAQEAPMIGLDQVRARLRVYEARVRRTRIALAAMAVVSLGVTGWVWLNGAPPMIRWGEALLALGFIMMLVRGWRRTSRRPTYDDAAACAAFLRGRLEERRMLARGWWVWVVAPLLPGLGVLLAAMAMAPGGPGRLAPILVLLIAWLVAMLAIQRRVAAALDTEIAELDRLRLG